MLETEHVHFNLVTALSSSSVLLHDCSAQEMNGYLQGSFILGGFRVFNIHIVLIFITVIKTHFLIFWAHELLQELSANSASVLFCQFFSRTCNKGTSGSDWSSCESSHGAGRRLKCPLYISAYALRIGV